MKENTRFRSVLGPWLEAFLAEKRSMGYKYETEETMLHHLDQWWDEHNADCRELCADRLEEWCRKRLSEGRNHLRHRICALRQFLKYMRGLGEVVWMPRSIRREPKPAVRVLSSLEIEELFTLIDAYQPASPRRAVIAIAREYPVIFRLILSTGLRNNEALSLRLEDVDLQARSLRILSSKKNKDRIVYMAPDMSNLLTDYIEGRISCEMFSGNIWLFPGASKNGHLTKGNLCKRFRAVWEQMSCLSGPESKNATVHSLRHTYVVMRINSWAASDVNVEAMLPFLARQLGHSSTQEVFYYFHQIYEGLEGLRHNDWISNRVLPEVMPK